MTILILNGPNINLLGARNPEIYGTKTLKEINLLLKARASRLGLRLKFFQSNHEGDLIDFLQKNSPRADRLIINAGALTHYGYALRDAIEDSGLKTVEVHLSDPRKREKFRRLSVISEVCAAVFKGKKHLSYLEALDFCARGE